jgi:hypothetical protein
MGKIYNVVFNSDIGGDTNTNSERFYYDWSQLEEGRYKCTFTFISAVGAVPNFAFVPNLFMDLGQGAYTQIASSNVPTSARIGAVFSSSYIGSLETKTLTTTAGSTSYYYAGLMTNPPFFLDNKPRNNAVQILIVTNGANQSTLYVPLPGIYTLTLQLEKLD